ncbi:MAG TPA: hypothetical protein VHS53_16895 [Mucilaginibacter sp.]|jgi:hypothetical protein|nr:hypothetical protein [Mucilaginibacter sp.]
MEPGTNPNPNPFDPNRYQPTRARVKKSHWAVILVVLVLLVVGGGWLVVKKVKGLIGMTNGPVVTGKYGEKRFDTTYAKPLDASIKTAKFTLNGGMCIYTLNDTTNQLINAKAVLYHSRYALKGFTVGSMYNMDLSMRSKSKTNLVQQSDSIGLRLNSAPLWDISVHTGEASLDFDLTKYKTRNINIVGSAGEFKLKLGQPQELTTVSFAVGAADITIKIPQTAACRIEKHSAMSSSNFDGFDKKDDGSYETKSYSSAKTRILIKFSGGVSDFKVIKY